VIFGSLRIALLFGWVRRLGVSESVRVLLDKPSRAAVCGRSTTALVFMHA
jgi:hypothetical protein